MTQENTANQWTSRMSFILAATGAAIGLGNIWKFPYMAGDYGGSAFTFIYILCMALIAIPAMIAEVMIGKVGRENPINTLKKVAIESKASPHWQAIGWIGALSLLMVLSFYSVIAGWSIAYIGYAASGLFQSAPLEVVHDQWYTLMASPGLLTSMHTLFMALTLWVVSRGVKQGIERASELMMPLLFATVLLLMLYSAWQGDIKAATHFLFHFDLARIDGQVIIAAMGHAFFTLAIGAGAMLTYGAYLPKRIPICQTITTIAVIDTLIAFMAGLAIFPLVFAHGLTPESGPGLMFQVLPISLMDMPFGRIIGTLFFALLLFASWTSSISMAEPLVVMLIERGKMTRKKASCIIGGLAWGLGLLAGCSFNVLSDVRLFGYGIFQIMTDVPTNILLPIGGLGFTIFAAWVIPKAVSEDALVTKPCYAVIWRAMTRYVAPIGILMIMVAGLIA